MTTTIVRAAPAAEVTAERGMIVTTSGTGAAAAGVAMLGKGGKVFDLNAGYNTVREETEPLTIPGIDPAALAATGSGSR